MISVISPPDLAEALVWCPDVRVMCRAVACEGTPGSRGGEWSLRRWDAPVEERVLRRARRRGSRRDSTAAHRQLVRCPAAAECPDQSYPARALARKSASARFPE